MNIPTYPRRRFEMTQADLDKILDACKPVPMIMLHIASPRSPQERANDAWRELSSRMGFKWDTVEPTGEGDRFFTAVPSESPEQRVIREKQEAEEKRLNEIESCRKLITDSEQRIADLESQASP